MEEGKNALGALDFDELDPDFQAAILLRQALDKIRSLKSVERTPKDRYVAITVTDLERVIAFFDYFVVRGAED